jgi:mono/diheme cytochrome c family protein
MGISVFRFLAVCGVLIACNAFASAQGIDAGKAEYRSNCAACHGIDGKGNGPVSKELKTHPTDLTVLAKKNNGVFPINALSKVIDGRESIGSHGTRDMPIWGYRLVPPEHYILKETDDFLYLPPASPEAIVQGRILAIIDYLNRIQEK